MENLIRTFMERSMNRDDAFYLQVPNQKRYRAVYKPPTIHCFKKHLDGDITLALPAVSTDGTSKWWAVDSDHDNGDLQRVEHFLASEGWHGLRESRRPEREGHLLYFFDRPAKTDLIIRFASEAISRVNADVEVVPKQARPSKLGSSLRTPLGINKKPGVWKRGWFEGPPHDVQAQLEWFALQPLNSADRLEEIAHWLMNNDLKKQQTSFTPTGLIRRNYNSQKINLFQSLPPTSLRRLGNDWVTQCPVCAREGHDKSRDNLHIKGDDGTVFSCWYGGQPGRIHTARMILGAYGL